MLKIKKKKKYILNSILNILTNNLVNFQTKSRKSFSFSTNYPTKLWIFINQWILSLFFFIP